MTLIDSITLRTPPEEPFAVVTLGIHHAEVVLGVGAHVGTFLSPSALRALAEALLLAADKMERRQTDD